MDEFTGESADELLAEWADTLRHRHGFRAASVVSYAISYGTHAEGEHAVTYYAQSNDASAILELRALFQRDIETRLAELENALTKIGVVVQRPS